MYLLTFKGVYNSARLLASKLGLKVTTSVKKLEGIPPIVRYGNSSGVFTEDTMYNHPDAIKLCGNSVKFSQWAKENEIRTPLYTKFDPTVDYEFPFLLRKARHLGGNDIVMIKNVDGLASLDTSTYYHVPFIETDSEIGVHVVNGVVVRIFRKLPTENSHPFIRSNKRGYRFSLVSNLSENYQVAQRLVLDAFEKSGLKFGRADVAYDSKSKLYYIWELNTAPGLNVNTAELYATHLRAVINVPE
jgi:glutathione synthase/RimK-type ligase-like ATP-grasp enzyme